MGAGAADRAPYPAVLALLAWAVQDWRYVVTRLAASGVRFEELDAAAAVGWLYETLVGEYATAWSSRAEVREKLDEHLMAAGAEMAALLTGRDVDDPRLPDPETWGDDPSNEQGLKALQAIAAKA